MFSSQLNLVWDDIQSEDVIYLSVMCKACGCSSVRVKGTGRNANRGYLYARAIVTLLDLMVNDGEAGCEKCRFAVRHIVSSTFFRDSITSPSKLFAYDLPKYRVYDEPLTKYAPTRGECRHCRRTIGLVCRGICCTCWRTPGVKEKYRPYKRGVKPKVSNGDMPREDEVRPTVSVSDGEDRLVQMAVSVAEAVSPAGSESLVSVAWMGVKEAWDEGIRDEEKLRERAKKHIKMHYKTDSDFRSGGNGQRHGPPER